VGDRCLAELLIDDNEHPIRRIICQNLQPHDNTMQDSLNQTLRQLHEQLGELDSLDDTEREQLKDAIREIEESLDRFDIRSSELAKRLHATTQEVARNHPHVTQAAGQVADMLSQLGI